MSAVSSQTRQWFTHHWYHLGTVLMMIAGAVYSLGFQARDIHAIQEQTSRSIKNIEERAMDAFSRQNSEISDLKTTIAARSAVIVTLTDDVRRLQWDRDNQNRILSEIGQEVRSTAKQVTEIDKTLRVVLQVLRPDTLKP